MNTVVMGLALLFIPVVVPFVAFYVAVRMVLNSLEQKLKELGAEL